MNSLSAKEFLKLIEESQDQDFDDDFNKYTNYGKPVSGIDRRIIDIIAFKKKDIIDALCSYTNIQVGNFLIRIDAYRGTPETTGSNLNLDITIFETILQTTSGKPCKMNYRINVSIDDRFNNQPWAGNFDTTGKAFNISIDTAIDVVRWMMALTKMIAFL